MTLIYHKFKINYKVKKLWVLKLIISRGPRKHCNKTTVFSFRTAKSPRLYQWSQKEKKNKLKIKNVKFPLPPCSSGKFSLHLLNWSKLSMKGLVSILIYWTTKSQIYNRSKTKISYFLVKLTCRTCFKSKMQTIIFKPTWRGNKRIRTKPLFSNLNKRHERAALHKKIKEVNKRHVRPALLKKIKEENKDRKTKIWAWKSMQVYHKRRLNLCPHITHLSLTQTPTENSFEPETLERYRNTATRFSMPYPQIYISLIYP